jgi:hypothetical protein
MPPDFPYNIRYTVLQIPPRPLSCPYAALTLYGPPFQESSDCLSRSKRWSITPHFLTITGRIRFALCCLQSPLLTASLLISSPAGTKTFQFPALPIITDHVRRHVKSHSGISGSKTTFISPEHFVACHALLRHLKPSHPPNSTNCVIYTLPMHGLINVKCVKFLTINLWPWIRFMIIRKLPLDVFVYLFMWVNW